MARRASPLLDLQLYLRRGPRLQGGFTEESPRGRAWEDLYRERWRHDKVVRSTHGVNCTGSCSWKIHVKDGVITWETQQTDYPSLGPDVPEYEPRGCARGASFSWYEYSPLRVRYPYVRASLLTLWRSALAQHGDPVAAWRTIAEDPQAMASYKSQRGKGGLIRATWDEVAEIIAAASVDTIKRYGPDRIVGFSPIPAMSMVSYASGTRFLSLIGGTILSFYDWYADLPIASPQIWGEQTDVPESADWYNTDYMLVWGSNLPMTRTPDAHFLAEARYRGTRVAAVSPDYAEYVKFADIWLAARPGSDGALAMAMTYVILKEFYLEHPTPYFLDYAKRFTDLSHLVVLEPRGDGYVTGHFLRAEEIGDSRPGGMWRTLVWDQERGPVAPNGSLGDRWDGKGRWNLRLEDPDGEIQPLLSLFDGRDGDLPVDFPHFGGLRGTSLRRHVPVRRVTLADGRELPVATVFDLLLAHVGISRGLQGDYPTGDDDERSYTPAWQESLTGVPKEVCLQVAREFAETAARTKGRAMIAMGAGINHWYHSDVTYRTIINLVLLTGCQGVQGGGWAHYVGQEKVRPFEGFSTIAFAADWLPLARQQNATSFFYFATDQFRYDDLDRTQLGWPGGGRFTAMHPADVNAMAARLGWLPSYPQFTENSLDLTQHARQNGATDEAGIAANVAARLTRGDLHLAIEHPDAKESFPRILFLWRANLLGSSGKGHEYFLRHLLGADGHILGDEPQGRRPETVVCDGSAPSGKLDLFVDIDFRMTGSGLYADIVLPAATWYEKTDLSSTDMHPFVHPFNPAISRPGRRKATGTPSSRSLRPSRGLLQRTSACGRTS